MASTKAENEESTAREDEERADERASTAPEGEGAAGVEASSDTASSDEGSNDESIEGASGDDEGVDDDDSGASSDGEPSDEPGKAAEATGGAADAAPVAKKTKGKGPRRHKKDGMTAGARLAAAKAAKAARKAAKLGKEKKAQDPLAQVRESALAKKAEEATSWVKENRTTVWAILAVLVLGLGGWAGYRYYSDRQAQAAAALLEDALEIAQAQIVAEDSSEGSSSGDERDEDEPPTYPTEQARAEAALEAFRAVTAQYPGSTAAQWARLGEAKALFDLGRYADARTAYEGVASSAEDPAIVWRALEGKAFTLEAEEQWDEALGVYEELSSLDGGRFEPIAKYHTARLYLVRGERERATETLRGLVDSLREAEDDEDAQDFEYVLAQAQARLRELDPSAAPAPASGPSPLGGGDSGGGLTDEQLQELIRRFQEQQQRGRGAGGSAGE